MAFNISIINPYPDSSVKDLLENHLLIPRKIRHFLRIKKHIRINDQLINWQTLVKTGDRIDFIFDDEDYPPKKISLGNPNQVNCLYEDEFMIIVNKPEGMKTHANEPSEIALLNHVSAYTKTTCYVVHRLDKETSGAIVFAKNPFILPILNRLLEQKKIKRQYWALVKGHFDKPKITYRNPIGRDRHDRRKRRIDTKSGKQAITHVTCLRRYHSCSLVNCELDTGRTHQIRVHLSHHYHPIIGDPLYSKKPFVRLMLHAHQLSLVHPITQENITIKAPSETFTKNLPSN